MLKPFLMTSLCSVALICCTFAIAESLNQQQLLQQAHDISQSTHQRQRKTQQEVNQLYDESQALLESYRQRLQEIDFKNALKVELKETLQYEKAQQKSLQLKLRNLEVTQQKIKPLIRNMHSTLKRFIELDVPFLKDERLRRLQKLEMRLNDPSITPPQKLSALLDVYQVESDYSRSIEAYQAPLFGSDSVNGKASSSSKVSGSQIEGKSNVDRRVVEYLRIGRVALYFQSPDGSDIYHWNNSDKRWEALPSSDTFLIANAIRVAKEIVTPSLLKLPLNRPEKIVSSPRTESAAPLIKPIKDEQATSVGVSAGQTGESDE